MTWTLIESQTLGSAASSVTFSSGLSSYKFFRLSGYVVNDTSAKTASLRLNGDSGANYARQSVSAISTTVAGARETGQPSIGLGYGSIAASGAATIAAIIAKPSSATKAQVVEEMGYEFSSGVALVLNGGEWNDTSNLISSIALAPSAGSFATGTSFLLEGLAA